MSSPTDRRLLLSVTNLALLMVLSPVWLIAGLGWLFERIGAAVGVPLMGPGQMLGMIGVVAIFLLARCPVCRGFPLGANGRLFGVWRFNTRPTTCDRCGADFRKLTYWTRVPRDDLLARMAFRKNKGLGSHDFSE